jgi:hypothetical protein
MITTTISTLRVKQKQVIEEKADYMIDSQQDE